MAVPRGLTAAGSARLPERKWVPVALVSPALLLLVAVSIFPLMYSLRVALMDWNMVSVVPPKFVGLGNFVKAFRDPLFWHGLRVTGVFALGVILFQLPAGLLLALLVNSLPRGSQLTATIMAIPMVISPSVVAFQWVQVLHQQFGPLDHILRLLGLPDPAWTADPNTALIALLIVDFWEWVPLAFLLLLGGLQAVPMSVIEAARTDGSTDWQVFWNITLPMLKPFVGIALILRLIATFKNLDLVYMMTQGGPGTTTTSLAYYTYKQGFTHFNVGYAAALAFIQLILINVLVKIVLNYAEKQRLRPN